MIRILLAFLVMCAFAVGLAWFADRPGELSVVWLGHEIETTFLFAIAVIILLCLLSVIIWAVIRRVFGTPAAITDFFRARRQRIGYDALSKGIIAIGSGDFKTACKSPRSRACFTPTSGS
jgi:HemY protein